MTEKLPPKLTVIVPCYNAENYIERCLSTILLSDYKNLEVIVVDNESTDSSLEKLKAIKESYPDIILDTAPNLYKYSWQEPVEKAWSLMTGEYFTIVGADDLVAPTYFSNAMKEMIEGGHMMMQSYIFFIEENDKGEYYGKYYMGHNYDNIEDLKSKMVRYCAVTTPSVFYKSEVLTKYKLEYSSDKYFGSNDYYAHCSLIDQGCYIYPCPKFLGYYYRTHPNQSSQGMLNSVGWEVDTEIRKMFREKWNINEINIASGHNVSSST